MSSHKDKDNEPGGEPEDMTRAALIKWVRRLKAKRLADRDEEEAEKDMEESEKERNKLADLHAETKGKPAETEVENDLPEGIAEAVESDYKSDKKTKTAKA